MNMIVMPMFLTNLYSASLSIIPRCSTLTIQQMVSLFQTKEMPTRNIVRSFWTTAGPFTLWLWWQLIYLHLLSIYLLFSHLRCLSSADKLELIWSKPGVLGETYLFKSRISIVSLVHLVPNARSFTSLAETREVPEDQDSFQMGRQIVQKSIFAEKLPAGEGGGGHSLNFWRKHAYFRPKWGRGAGYPHAKTLLLAKSCTSLPCE